MTDTTAGTDFLGRTPEEADAARQRAREDRERIQARDWREIPKGHYALPVYGFTEWADHDCLGEVPVIGYRLFERKTARHCKNGRVIGRERFISGRVMHLPDVDPDAVRMEVTSADEIARETFGPGGDRKDIFDLIMRDIADGDTFRAKFGQLTGRCGHCHMRLTDPKSKLIGIGPDCRGYR
jgi:Family of unknown function (DUF6011)